MHLSSSLIIRWAAVPAVACSLMLAPLVTPLGAASLSAAESTASTSDTVNAARDLVTRGQTWILAQQQADGSFTPFRQWRLGISLIALDALMGGDGGLAVDDPRVLKTRDMIFSYIQPDGGIYDPEEGVTNYTTSLALMVLARMPDIDPTIITNAQNYIVGLQNTSGGINDGGLGYGSSGPGHEDLSNTSHAVEALAASGMPADHPAMQRALAFISRCQNLSSTNPLHWAGKDGPVQGGAVYAPHESKAGGSWSDEEQAAAAVAEAEATGALRSYGSMTYALIKSFIYLDLDKTDPRLAAALNWVTHNYQFEVNPGMPAGQERQGLLFYYMNMAKSFHLAEMPTVTLPDGTVADWRVDLLKHITKLGNAIDLADGAAGTTWINSAPRWGEGFPHLATPYMVKTLKRIIATVDA